MTGTVAFLSMPTPLAPIHGRAEHYLVDHVSLQLDTDVVGGPQRLAGHILIFRKLLLERCIADQA